MRLPLAVAFFFLGCGHPCPLLFEGRRPLKRTPPPELTSCDVDLTTVKNVDETLLQEVATVDRLVALLEVLKGLHFPITEFPVALLKRPSCVLQSSLVRRSRSDIDFLNAGLVERIMGESLHNAYWSCTFVVRFIRTSGLPDFTRVEIRERKSGMRFIMTITLAVLCSVVFQGVAAESGPAEYTPSPTTVGWEFGGNHIQICLEVTGGTIPSNPTSPELNGYIENKTKNIKKIRDIKAWIEDKTGAIIKTGGVSPVSGLSINTNGSNYTAATIANQSDGVTTFNLPNGGHINQNSFKNYRLDFSAFTQPNKWKMCMQISDTKASTSIHYMCLALQQLTNDGNTRVSSVGAPIHRSGVVIGIENDDDSDALSGLSLAMATQQTGLQITSVEVRLVDQSDTLVTGASIEISSDGLSVEISDIEVERNALVNIWVDLSSAPTKTTTFSIDGAY